MTTDAQAFAQLQKLPPADAVSYLQERQQVVETFGWQDLWQEEHTRQFTISRLAQADLLAALQEMITQSVQGDLSRRDFARNARQMLADAGWWGPREVIEPETGEIHKTTFDSSRMKLVFDVNTRQAYAAGQWERIQRSKTTHPFLRYITKRDERVRASHRSWDNITLPIDDQFWHTHYPPNGWRCRCRVTAVSQAEFDKGVAPSGQPMVKVAPDVVLRDWLNRRSGEVEQVPAGIDPGWAYNPGQAGARAAELKRLAESKLASADPALSKAARQAGLFETKP